MPDRLPLRRMPGMFHSVLDRFQSVSKRFVSLIICDRIFRTIQIVLSLSTTAGLQPLELERSENYSVSNEAYARGHGGPQEIWLLRSKTDREIGSFNLNLAEGRKKT